jgi:hypothetical protein
VDIGGVHSANFGDPAGQVRSRAGYEVQFPESCGNPCRDVSIQNLARRVVRGHRPHVVVQVPARYRPGPVNFFYQGPENFNTFFGQGDGLACVILERDHRPEHRNDVETACRNYFPRLAGLVQFGEGKPLVGVAHFIKLVIGVDQPVIATAVLSPVIEAQD